MTQCWYKVVLTYVEFIYMTLVYTCQMTNAGSCVDILTLLTEFK
jgi:hypothetical protein